MTTATNLEGLATSMAMSVVARAFKQGREQELLTAMDTLQNRAEGLLEEALALVLPYTGHADFFGLLYGAAPLLRASHQIGRYVMAILEETPKAGSPSFRKDVAKTRHVVEEKVIRVQDSLVGDAEDIVGASLARHREQVMRKRASHGARAAALEAMQFTTHGLRYPRALEPYLRGETNELHWKATWSINNSR